MKQYFGWVQGSKIASVYVHLSGRDVDKALLRLNGIEVEEYREELKFKSTIRLDVKPETLRMQSFARNVDFVWKL